MTKLDDYREMFQQFNTEQILDLYDLLVDKYENKGIFNNRNTSDFIRIITNTVIFDDYNYYDMEHINHENINE